MRIKKRNIMKSIVGGMIIVMSMSLLSACGGNVQEMVEDIIEEGLTAQSPKEEEVADEIMESPLENDVIDEDMEFPEESIEDLMDETEEVLWPKEVPDIFVEFDYGYGLLYEYFKDDNDDVWVLTYVDVDMNDVEAYNKDLEKAGWVLADFEEAFMYVYVQDNYEITITLGSNEDGSIWYTLYLSHEIPNEGGSDLNHMDGGDIPDGYPADELPVYESATSVLVGAEKIDAGGSTIYLIEIGCDESSEEIAEVILPYLEALNEEKVMKVLVNGNGMLQGESEIWNYTIRLEVIEYEGKATSVVYQVTPLTE